MEIMVTSGPLSTRNVNKKETSFIPGSTFALRCIWTCNTALPRQVSSQEKLLSTLHYQTVSALWWESIAFTGDEKSQCGCYHDYLTLVPNTHTHTLRTCDKAILFFLPCTPAPTMIPKAVITTMTSDVIASYQNDCTA